MTQEEQLSGPEENRVFDDKKKWVECLKCGKDCYISTQWPLKDSWCKNCRASGRHLRIMRPNSPGYRPEGEPAR